MTSEQPASAAAEVSGIAPAEAQEASGARRLGRALVHLSVITAVLLIAALFQLGTADWRDDSESCGGQIVQEIMAGEGWILPLRNERHIPVKPPLFYWLGAVSATLRGTAGDFLDARLPSVALALLCAFSLYLFSRAVAGDEVALWSTLILVTTPQFVIEARNSRVDIALCAFLTPGLMLAHQVCEGKGRRIAAYLAALCLGLAVLSKGPLALGLAVLVLGLTAVVAAPAPGWRILLAPVSLALAVGLPALWYMGATIEHGWAFIRLHIYVENVSRLLGQQGNYPWWWYLEPLITGGLPWTLLLPLMLSRNTAVPARSRRFLWVWVLAMLVFFSVSPGKRRAYLLLIRPALAILMAGWLVPQLARLRALRREVPVPRAVHIATAIVVVCGIATVLLLRFGVGGFGAAPIERSYGWRDYLQTYLGLTVVLVIGLGAGLDLLIGYLWQYRFENAGYALVAMMTIGLAIGVSAGAIVRGEGATFRHVARQIETEVPAGQPLAFWDLDDDSAIALLFHLRRHIPVVKSIEEGGCLPPAPGFYLVHEARWDSTPCFRDARWQAIARGGPEARSQRWRRLVLARYAPAEAS